MSNATEHFISPLLVHFELRKHNPEQFLADLTDRLQRYPADVLRLAAESLITGRDKTTFPTVTECLRAIAAVRGTDSPDPSRRIRVKSDSHDPTRWNPLLECPLGEQAAEEGWIICLLDFANRNGCLPNSIRECDSLRAEANRIRNHTLADPFHRALAETWDRRTAALGERVMRVEA